MTRSSAGLCTSAAFWMTGLLGCGSQTRGAHPLPAATASASAASATSTSPVYCSTSEVAKSSPDLIARVEVRGIVRLPVDDVCGGIKTKAGAEVDEDRIHKDAAFLWGSGLIDSVDVASQISASGRSVTFMIRERPTIRKTTVEGVHAGDPSRVLAMFPAAGHSFDPADIRTAINQVREEYLEEAYRRADAQFTIDPAPNNQVDVNIVVVEGPQALVSAITLHGESKDREADLMALIDTGGGTFNTPGKPYRPDVLERDRLIMNDYYFDRGMVNANVADEELTLSDDGTSAGLSIEITEGMVYKLGKLRCVGDIAQNEKQCLTLLGIKSGEIFNRRKLTEGMGRLLAFQTENHRGRQIEPETSLDSSKSKIDITVKVSKEDPAPAP